MLILKKVKSNKAATLTDVVIGLLILILFTGILTTSFYKIYSHNMSIRMNAVAVDYTIKILEDIDRMPYEKVTNSLNNTIIENYSIKEGYTAKLDIKNYNEDDETKEDLIKIVTLTINYKSVNGDESYSVKKLKIKEI